MRALSKAGCVGVAVAATTLGLVAAGSVSGATPRVADASAAVPGSYGQLPPTSGTPASKQGILTYPLEPGSGPNWIFPIVPGANYTSDTISFTDYSWRPLWWDPDGTKIAVDWTQSLAGAPVFTDDNKTATITLKSGWKWSDGQPITSQDVLFDFWLYKAAVNLSPENAAGYTPGFYPSDVISMSAPNSTTVVVHFSATHNQLFAFYSELGELIPLPAHAWAETSANGPIITNFANLKTAEKIYNFLANSNPKSGPLGQAEDLKTYASNPLWQVVDGPFKISAYDPATGGFTMLTNPNYSGPVKTKIAGVRGLYFTSESSEVDAYLSGDIDVGLFPHAFAAQMPALRAKGYTIWGYPEDEFGFVVLNFKDPTGDWGHMVNQLYVRQAMQHLVDQEGIIKSRAIWGGLAVPDYGTLSTAPPTVFTTPGDAEIDPYPFSVPDAKAQLVNHGWKVVPGGVSTCVNPGSGPKQCGAGIKEGDGLETNYYYANNSPIGGYIGEALAADFSKVGIKLTLIGKGFNYMIANLDDPAAPTEEKLWGMEEFGYYTQTLYPTAFGTLNTTGSDNLGGISIPAVDQAIHDSVFSTNNRALEHEIYVETYDLPGLFLPNEYRLLAVKKGVVGPAFSFENLPSDAVYNPEYWYFTS